jgi:hypothetical protein
MIEQVLQVGSGRVIGVSNNKEQKGKTLELFDGGTILCHLPLDEAFPFRPSTEDDEGGPGVELNMQFTSELRSKTDGVVDIIFMDDETQELHRSRTMSDIIIEAGKSYATRNGGQANIYQWNEGGKCWKGTVKDGGLNEWHKDGRDFYGYTGWDIVGVLALVAEPTQTTTNKDRSRDILPSPISITDSTYSSGGYIGMRIASEQASATNEDMQKANATIARIIEYVQGKGFKAIVDPQDEYSTVKRLRLFKMAEGRQVYSDLTISVEALLVGNDNIWQYGVNGAMSRVDEAIEKGPPEQFAGFARLLLQELDDAIGRITKRFSEEGGGLDEKLLERETAHELGTIIARRACVLVKHTVMNVAPIDLDRLDADEIIERIPDLTEWPEAEENVASAIIRQILAINGHIQHKGPLYLNAKSIAAVALDCTCTFKDGEETALNHNQLRQLTGSMDAWNGGTPNTSEAILACVKEYGPIDIDGIVEETGYIRHVVEAAVDSLVSHGLIHQTNTRQQFDELLPPSEWIPLYMIKETAPPMLPARNTELTEEE